MPQFSLNVHIFAVIILMRCAAAASHDWGYPDLDAGEEFQNWGGFCDTGKRQSPINLRLDTSLKGIYEKIDFSNYDKDQQAMSIVNNGHSVQLANFTHRMSMKNGPLEGEYVIEQIHLHWWSEHTINNVRYPLEVHIVHRNKDYPDMTVAAAHRDGIAVLAILYHMSNEKNDAIDVIVDNLDEVKNAEKLNKPVNLKGSFNVNQFFPEISGYFTYPGSLTTPSCAEAVTWIVMQQTFPVTQKQIKNFQGIHASSNKFLRNNYRPVQSTNNRPVIAVEYDFKSSATSNMPFAMLLLLSLVLLNMVY